MAAPIIEAKSLSSLTALASNPPAYPRNPTHIKHEPLVLYIARVPGSRDVFLSPMKPREKVVTAEDIQSSLYFVHVEQPEDTNLQPPNFGGPGYSEQRQPSTNPDAVPVIPRKAVPGAASVQRTEPNTLAPVANYDSRQNVNAGNYAQRHGALAPEFNPRCSFDSTQYRQENQRPAASPRRLSENPPRASSSLTLIRRDPASGAQWNVARIEDPPILEISSAPSDDPNAKRRTGAPMYIEVFNPGYSKFLHAETAGKPSLSSRNSAMSVQLREMPQSLMPGSHPEPVNHAVPSDNTFRRRLWMEGSQYLGGGFGHRKKNSYDYNNERPTSRGSYSGQLERSSLEHQLPSAPFVSRESQAYSSIQVSDKQTSFRGYVFTSPWNGRCEFVTGAGGGSLKCRHIVSGQGTSPVASTVSELRFNLPSNTKGATLKGEETSRRSSLFHRGRHSRNNSVLSVNRDDGIGEARNSLDRLDLSLGQEFAGGGFGGKQAKLGKIILEDEGLKMMDLLVAANLGLWWRAYEKANASI